MRRLSSCSEQARELGPDLRADDAAYVALAERLDAVLVTVATRRSRAPGLRDRGRLIPVDNPDRTP